MSLREYNFIATPEAQHKNEDLNSFYLFHL